MKKGLVLLILLILVIIILFWYLGGRVSVEKRPPILLKTASGIETTEFQLHDTILFDAVNLSPGTGYTVQITREDGAIVAESVLSTDREGRIPETVIWYDIGIKHCPKAPVRTDVITYISEYEITDVAYPDKNYALKIIKDEKIVREMRFRVVAEAIRPKLYAVDSRGCPKSGFLIGEEDVWVVGSNFPKGSIIRLWAVPADSERKDSTPLIDKTKQHDELPPLFELKRGETIFKKLLWPKGLTSVGSYDIVAEVVTYSFGSYHASSTASVQNVVSNLRYSGFVIQRRLGIGEPLEQDAAGIRMSRLAFRDTFLTTENVFVGVDPYIQPGYIGKTAKIYIVADKTDAQWATDKSLNDVTGTVETVTIQPGGCANAYSSLAWAPTTTTSLPPGRYDVVLDFNMNGQYDQGVDLIDSLDAAGFTVADVRVESIFFNYGGSGAITIRDNIKGNNISAPEYSCGPCDEIKPAAWVMGTPRSVLVNFKAVPSVNSAKIWAENGLGGLNSGSPVTVSFTSGSGQGMFTANTVPAYIGKHLFDWDWKYKDMNGSPSGNLDIGTTGKHILYTVLSNPQAPQAEPWLEALDIASNLAYGRTTAADAVRDIWDDFYNNAGGLYDIVGGSPQYTSSTSQNFDLTSWLVNYKSGNIGTVNCYDMGKAVVVFSNALGSNTVYTYVSPFGYLNCIKPIGRGWTNNPFYGGYPSTHPYSNPIINGDDLRTGFGNHGFTMLGGQIYDGSGGKVDIDTDVDNCSSVNPRNLDGNDSWTNDYKNRVIDNVPLPPYGTGSPTDYGFNVN